MYLTHKNLKGNLLFFALAKYVGQLVITNVFNTQEMHSSCLAFFTHINTDSYKSEDFLLNPICILCIIVCLYVLFYVQSIQINTCMFKSTHI